MTGAGITIAQGSFENPVSKVITRFDVAKIWTPRRLLLIAQGVVSGIGFVSPLIILLVLGREGILGTVTAVASFLTMGAIYLYGRFMDDRHQYAALIVSNIMLLLCALGLAFLPGHLNTIVYVLLAPIFASFIGLVTEPIFLSLMEHEMGTDEELRYSFIFDNELVLNFGRLIGIGLILISVYFGSHSSGIFYGPLLAVVVQSFF